ncbi:MAG: cadmium resistance transporter [Lyngbya sp. HA4199-MV5]|nr:cadmium resistance transporter [Lyngbya sp. HA4199-MV5]
MNWFIQAVVAGVTAFIATNIDDIVILMLFFAQVNATFRPKHIFVGQYIGFTILVALSLPGFFGGLVLPKAWIGLLGLVPIAIGLKELLDQKRGKPNIQAVSDEWSQPQREHPIRSKFASLFSPPIYQVTTITIANGGDNVGIYVPLFASSSPSGLAVILITFFFMVSLWCFIAYQLTQHPLVAQGLTRWGGVIVPFVLIGLGIYILMESEAYQLLPGL